MAFALANSSVGPRLVGIYDTLLRTKRLEGWYGLYKGKLSINVHN